MSYPDNYIFIRKEVKHARVRVSEDGRIRIILPLNFSEKEVESLIRKKQRWIEKHLEFFEKMSRIELQRNQILLYGNRYSYFYDTNFENKVVVNHEYKTIRAKRDLLDKPIQEKWGKAIAKKHISKRIDELAGKLGFSYNRLYIRNQKRKFGNCSKDKNISINWRLIKSPLFVIDYILIHELVHTIEMSHTKKFWTLLRSYYPDYKDAIDWLDKYGNSL
ncbi:MAG: SprT family zinc-dependent metalloprotease [Paludibacter sp.]|nr:SprT family zinc-dependent metalloprotease [Paludibacter sp.]